MSCLGGIASALWLTVAFGADGAPSFAPKVTQRPAVTGLKIVNDRWPDASTSAAFARDAVRLSGAETDQAKALAVWQWMRRCTMRLKTVPHDHRGRYVDDPLVILNIFGAHHCDGLSRVMQNCWRGLGYPARKYYRNGHTYADCWWVDGDGVGRFHTFDNNYGWFLFTRDGSRLATGEEIGTDFSLFDVPSRTHVPWIDKKYWMWSWVHAPHKSISDHSMLLDLAPGAELERLWGNIGRPYQDQAQLRIWYDPDPRPYEWTYGNGIHRFAARFDPAWRERLAAEPVNAVVRDGRLVQDHADTAAEVVYCIETPYIIADADIALTAEGGRVEMAMSKDVGRTWTPVGRWTGTGRTAHAVTLTKAGLDRRTGPIARYRYWLRLRLHAGAAVHDLRVDTIVQHNFLVLPTLLPGDNRITLNGNLAKGRAVEVTYVWDDPAGHGHTQTVKATRLPYTYTVRAAGGRWKDVRCRRLTVRAVPNDAKGNRILMAPPPPPDGAVKPVVWTDVLTLNGPDPAPALRTTAAYLTDLRSDSADVRRAAAAGLIVRRDPKAWDALERLAYDDITTVKYYAIQALHWTDARRAWPIEKAILEQDPKVTWPDVPFSRPRRGMHTSPEAPIFDNVASLISVLCARSKTPGAAPVICEALKKVRYPEPKWGMLRSLGRLGDPAAKETVRRYVYRGRGGDPQGIAIRAAARLGDREIIPRCKTILESRWGYGPRTVAAIEALGLLGAEDGTDLLIQFLKHKDEDYRLASAEALGRIGDPKAAVPAIEAAMKVETFAAVRDTMQTAIEALRVRAKS